MSKIGIVCDSNCDLPVEVINKYDIRIVPGKIIFGDEEVRRHYIDITYEEFYRRLVHDKENPKTSVPSPKDYQSIYEDALKKYEELIVFCTSSKLSNMFNIASMVAKQFFDGKVTVIDSQTITLPMGIVVSETAKKAAEGTSKEELLSYAQNNLMKNAHAFGGVPTLTYLQRGGRIGKVKSLMGNLMQVKPILSIENGELVPLGKVRGIENISVLILDFAKKMFVSQESNIVIIGHTANLEEAKKVVDKLETFPNAPKDIQIIELGPSVGTHLGPGGLLIAWLGEFNKGLLAL